MPTEVQLNVAMAKTLLHRARDIDRQIQWEGRQFGLRVQSGFGTPKSATTIIDGVIAVMERTDKLIVLKNKIEQIVDNMPKGIARVVRSYFFARDVDITPLINQQLQQGIKLFVSQMGRYGIDKKMFKHFARLYPWLAQDLVKRLSTLARQHNCKCKKPKEINKTNDQRRNVGERRCA